VATNELGSIVIRVEVVSLIVDVDRNRTVRHEELMLLHKQRQSTLKNISVVGVLDISLDHLRQQRRLRSVEVVDTSAIGDEAVLLNEIKKVLDGVLCNVDEGATSSKKTLDDPVRIPVIGLTETTTSDDEGSVDGDETVGAIAAVPGVLVVATSQVRPDIDDLLCEFLDGSVVDLVEELGVCFKLIFRDFLKLTTSIGKVVTEKLRESRIVT